MAMTMDIRGQGRGLTLVGAASPAERAGAFRVAGRHTFLVRVLRKALPVIAVCLCVGYVLALRTSWKIGDGRLDVGKIELGPDDMTMKNPSYFGVNKDGSRYEVRAQRAVLELNAQAPVKLIGIDGRITQTNNVVTNLRSKSGLLDNSKGILELYDGIEIDASSGMSARMSRATVYSKENRVVSNEPVQLSMPTGTVRGGSLAMNTNTKETTLVGNVAVNMVPGASQGAGFGRDTRQPVDVASEQLYINDTDRIALFTGGVVATQGDTVMKTPELRIAYEGKASDQLIAGGGQPAKPEASKAGSGAAAPDEGSSRLSRMTAAKGAVITMGTDRRVTADQVDFDAKADTALFLGNVVVNQQRNVLQGRRMFIDRKNARSRLDSPSEGGREAGRITAVMYQGDGKAQAAKPKQQPLEAVSSVQEGMMGSFKMDPNAPMNIEASSLEVFDTTKQAIFRTNVKAEQGDITIRTVELIAHYSGQAGFGMAGPEEPKGQSQSSLTRVETKEKVLITSKDGQSATGDSAVFDVKANTVLLVGHVVVTRGKDIAEGPRLKIDLTTGMYRFELENEGSPSAAQQLQAPRQPGPVVSSNPAETPTGRTCPPGKQCLLFFPQEAKERAKGAINKLAPGASVGDSWAPNMGGGSGTRGN